MRGKDRHALCPEHSVTDQPLGLLFVGSEGPWGDLAEALGTCAQKGKRIKLVCLHPTPG